MYILCGCMYVYICLCIHIYTHLNICVCVIHMYVTSGSQPKVILSPRGHLGLWRLLIAMTWGLCCWHPVSRGMLARDAARHPTMHRTVRHDKEISGPKCHGSEVKKPYTHTQHMHACVHTQNGWERVGFKRRSLNILNTFHGKMLGSGDRAAKRHEANNILVQKTGIKPKIMCIDTCLSFWWMLWRKIRGRVTVFGGPGWDC